MTALFPLVGSRSLRLCACFLFVLVPAAPGLAAQFPRPDLAPKKLRRVVASVLAFLVNGLQRATGNIQPYEVSGLKRPHLPAESQPDSFVYVLHRSDPLLEQTDRLDVTHEVD